MKNKHLNFILYVSLLGFASALVLAMFPDLRNKDIYNQELRSNVEMLANAKDSIELLFIGSSKIKHHINDQLFSKVTGIKSLNLGVPATNPPETYVIFEQLLNSGYFDNKTVILEVRSVSEIVYKNWWQARSTYWVDNNGVKQAFSLVDANQMGKLRKYFAKASYLLANVSNLIGLNILQEDLFGLPNNVKYEGFTTLDNRKVDCEFLKSLNENTVEVIDSNIEISNSGHYDYLFNLIVLSKEKRCNLIFYLAETNLDWQIKELYPLFNKLPDANKIAIVDSRTYPFLNNCDIKYNVTHFDEKGADSLTYAMAKEFLKIEKIVK